MRASIWTISSRAIRAPIRRDEPTESRSGRRAPMGRARLSRRRGRLRHRFARADGSRLPRRRRLRAGVWRTAVLAASAIESGCAALAVESRDSRRDRRRVGPSSALPARSFRAVVRRRPRACRRGRTDLRSVGGSAKSSSPRRRAQSSTTRRSPSPIRWTIGDRRALSPPRACRAAVGELLSFFTPAGGHSRHVVLRDKERAIARRHGAMLRSGAEMLPTEDTLCATAWMHGVFAAQLTIGNTTFHKLFSVSRDPYNIMRGNGLRILADWGRDGGSSPCRRPSRWGFATAVGSTNSASGRSLLRRASRAGSRLCSGASPPKAANAASSSLAIWRSANTSTPAAAASRSTRSESNSSSARSRRLVGKAIPARLLPPGDQHAQGGRGDRRRRIALPRRRAAGRRLRRYPQPADASFDFSVVGSMTDEPQAAALAAKYAKGVDDSVCRRIDPRVA